MPQPLLGRLARSYGTRLKDVMCDATSLKDLGRHFGAGFYEAEVRYLTTYELARTDGDLLWRPTKIGLHMSAAERVGVARFHVWGPLFNGSCPGSGSAGGSRLGEKSVH